MSVDSSLDPESNINPSWHEGRAILMGVVVITCPHTGEDVSTGIEIDQHSFQKLPDVLVRSKCPQCGMQHSWWTREARLSADPRNADLQIEQAVR
jgi:hypothetical protein